MKPSEIDSDHYFYYIGDDPAIKMKWKTYNFFLPTNDVGHSIRPSLEAHCIDYVVYETRYWGWPDYLAFETGEDLNAAKLLQ